MGFHFFDYPIDYVFQNNEQLPDRSGRGRDIRLRFDGSPPEIRADDTGLHHLHLEGNAEIIVMQHPDLNSPSFTVELYGSFLASTKAGFVLHDRNMVFPAYGVSREIKAELELANNNPHTMDTSTQSNDDLTHLAFRFHEPSRIASITVNTTEVMQETLSTGLFSSATGDIVIGNYSGDFATGSLYFARLLDLSEQQENLTVTHNCKYNLSNYFSF